MNDMKEKAMGAVKAFLERKGYEIVDEAWQGPEGIGGIDLVAGGEGGAPGVVDAPGRIAQRGVVDTPVRFDEVAMLVVKENRALLRHHVNCFGEMEPLS